jgi:SAM-dependent methyltransferase
MTRGLRQIVRLNWPFYAAAASAIAIAWSVAQTMPLGPLASLLLATAAGAVLFWVVASLVASWLVYDLSPLTTWQWVRLALGADPRTWINIHAGLDESTSTLRRLLAKSESRVFDIFDPVEMTEPSIARARAAAAHAPIAESVDYRHLPAAPQSVDAALLLLSAHELRSDASRCALFAELHRVLAPDGRVIVAEHLRDWANTLAFGPGALHFHSRRTWIRCFARTGFCLHDEFAITPFVHVFILTRSPCPSTLTSSSTSASSASSWPSWSW